MNKRCIFDAIREDRVSSRREIARLFALRSTSVSEIVGELIEYGLVTEVAGRTSGRGRPANVLVANTRTLAVMVFQVISQSVKATIVDIAGSVLLAKSHCISLGCNNAEMHGVLTQLLESCIEQVPQETELTGVAFSLSGVLDVTASRWMFCSRWPALAGLELESVIGKRRLDIAVTRNLDAELHARLYCEAVDDDDGTLILHWGYGIGTAYAIGGRTVNAEAGRFGEIGHWRMMTPDGALCRCGRHGCLETVASLWALHPRFKERWPNTSIDETKFGEQAHEYDLLQVPEMNEALDAMVVGLANLCRILFPRNVIISGPFTVNAAVWEIFNERFHEESGLAGSNRPQLISGQRNEELELEGAARPLLDQALERRLGNV